MAERKVVNKYYPPDFDPAKIPRRRQPKNQQIKVRTMLPMTIRCRTCGAYMYKGTKFNSRKEDAAGEKYLGIQVFRFYSRCSACSAEFTYKTDPRNLGYVIESGAEPWRSEAAAAAPSSEEVDGDAMRMLENKASDSKRKEMDMLLLVALGEMRSRRAAVTVDSMLLALQSSSSSSDEKAKRLEEEDALIRSFSQNSEGRNVVVRRIDDEEDDEPSLVSSICCKGYKRSGPPLKPIFVVKRRRSEDSDGGSRLVEPGFVKEEEKAGVVSGLQTLCESYYNSSSDD